MVSKDPARSKTTLEQTFQIKQKELLVLGFF